VIRFVPPLIEQKRRQKCSVTKQLGMNVAAVFHSDRIEEGSRSLLPLSVVYKTVQEE